MEGGWEDIVDVVGIVRVEGGGAGYGSKTRVLVVDV